MNHALGYNWDAGVMVEPPGNATVRNCFIREFNQGIIVNALKTAPPPEGSNLWPTKDVYIYLNTIRVRASGYTGDPPSSPVFPCAAGASTSLGGTWQHGRSVGIGVAPHCNLRPLADSYGIWPGEFAFDNIEITWNWIYPEAAMGGGNGWVYELEQGIFIKAVKNSVVNANQVNAVRLDPFNLPPYYYAWRLSPFGAAAFVAAMPILNTEVKNNTFTQYGNSTETGWPYAVNYTGMWACWITPCPVGSVVEFKEDWLTLCGSASYPATCNFDMDFSHNTLRAPDYLNRQGNNYKRPWWLYTDVQYLDRTQGIWSDVDNCWWKDGFSITVPDTAIPGVIWDYFDNSSLIYQGWSPRLY
jgi:hypothetical protein